MLKKDVNKNKFFWFLLCVL